MIIVAFGAGIIINIFSAFYDLGSLAMHVVTIGCGVAGTTAAMTIRERSPDTEISIYTDESHFYYPRPRLYEVILGEKEPQEIYSFAKQWYEDKRIRVYLNKKVVEIETAHKELLLQDGSRINYDKLLLANGAHPFLPPMKGIEKMGVFTLRTVVDALAIREYAEKAKNAIVVGGGFLGLESAASLKEVGKQVVDISPRLLPTQLDQDGATILKDQLETFGISFVLGVKPKEILGKDAVSAVSLEDGRELSGDLVLIAAGVRPNTELAAKAGIKVNRGVIIDQYMQTSVGDVYAAGDIVEFEGKTYGIIPPAVEQARTAGMNILENEKRAYNGTIPSTTLKIVGISLTSIGLVNPEGPNYEEIKKIKKEEGVYKKIVLEHGKIVGVIVLGERGDSSALKRLIDQEADVTKYKGQILENNFDYRKILS